MEHLSLPEAQLLYAIYKLEHDGRLKLDDKKKLKQMVISQDEKIFSLLDQYKEDQNEASLLQDMLKIVKPIRHKPETVAIPPRVQTTEDSSPLGKFLCEQKKRQSAEHGLTLSLYKMADEVEEMPPVEEMPEMPMQEMRLNF
ncbi:unnamed protein product [Blepharisma stoltei]|uniref:Uncharacterized protein n=1 Tax=Blepharisma stoltei TaxID=1481888 RepID=A0AAU9JLJ2_9CILI|nr:unnamed protein product [Blepharisma stoltei]